jgi:acyl-CoA synthetase (AMP-forming)/AMP-acid ligase II
MKYDLSTHECAIHAAAPCPIEIKKMMIEWWGEIINEFYAGSEGNGFFACNSKEWLSHVGTVGKPIFGIPHICDEEGNELSTGSEGTIWFESDVEFSYHNDEKKTLETRHPKNSKWTTLGDIGKLDEDNYLYLTDRKAFMIISGGVNIYPQETEDLIITHPKVFDCAVIGVPNQEFGEEVKAVVQPISWNDTGKDLEEEIIEFCKKNLSSIKCPKTVDFEKELPRHPTGKLYKRLLKDRYWGKKDTKIV